MRHIPDRRGLKFERIRFNLKGMSDLDLDDLLEDLPAPKAEAAKRKPPLSFVARKLFLLSGNLCAFPGCNRLMMSPEGGFVGEICHIEAVKAGGERFNKNQTNDDRRAFENLMLMCHDHHVETDNVELFPVQRMQKIKADHEKKITDFAANLQFRVEDLTRRDVDVPSSVLAKLADLLQWHLGEAELRQSAADLNSYLLPRLKALPPQARSLLVVAIRRSWKQQYPRTGRLFHPEEVDLVCGLAVEISRPLYDILDRLNLARDIGENETGTTIFRLVPIEHGWEIWDDFLAAEAGGIATLEELIQDLNFGLLG